MNLKPFKATAVETWNKKLQTQMWWNIIAVLGQYTKRADPSRHLFMQVVEQRNQSVHQLLQLLLSSSHPLLLSPTSMFILRPLPSSSPGRRQESGENKMMLPKVFAPGKKILLHLPWWMSHQLS